MMFSVNFFKIEFCLKKKKKIVYLFFSGKFMIRLSYLVAGEHMCKLKFLVRMHENRT